MFDMIFFRCQMPPGTPCPENRQTRPRAQKYPHFHVEMGITFL